MKKIIAGLVVVSFLVAAMPRPVYADHRGASPAALGIAFGAVALIIGILTLGTSRDHGKTIEAKERVDIEHIKASAASGAKVSCGDEPCENSYISDTAGTATVRHSPIVQPIIQNVRSLRANSDGGESPLYEAGARAARQGDEGARALCAGETRTSDYCRGYNAAMRRR